MKVFCGVQKDCSIAEAGQNIRFPHDSRRYGRKIIIYMLWREIDDIMISKNCKVNIFLPINIKKGKRLMQLLIRHRLPEKLVLPLAYHHMIQAIIYRNLNPAFGYSRYIHDDGIGEGERSYKFFTFSLLRGKYEIRDGKIIFRDEVSFELRSPDLFMLKMTAENLSERGIRYGKQYYPDVDIFFSDACVESSRILIRMISPLSVHSTDENTGKTHFYSPDEEDFSEMVSDNFIRKYMACYGVVPSEGIEIRPVKVTGKDKYVTKYKNFYITGWNGEYELRGRRKYLDFLYHAGLGSRNSQGFGMFDLL